MPCPNGTEAASKPSVPSCWPRTCAWWWPRATASARLGTHL